MSIKLKAEAKQSFAKLAKWILLVLQNFGTAVTIYNGKSSRKQYRNCRKLPPATGKYTTLPVEVPTMEIKEDICPYSKTEATTKTLAYSIIFYVL